MFSGKAMATDLRFLTQAVMTCIESDHGTPKILTNFRKESNFSEYFFPGPEVHDDEPEIRATGRMKRSPKKSSCSRVMSPSNIRNRRGM